uniref:Phospholipase A(2) n=1 Tax=Rhabditophanes sp. KR3021 TaxID=114890 RepID=A0AC35THL4_9BILA
MFTLTFFLTLLLISFNKAEEQEWECGSDGLSKIFSEASIDGDCPELKWQVNGCCVKHDKCYDDQLGQIKCDDTFCQCLDRVTAPSKKCFDEDSKSFCELVREFGEGAYLASAPNATTIGKTISTTTAPKITSAAIIIPDSTTSTITDAQLVTTNKTKQGSLNETVVEKLRGQRKSSIGRA